MPETPRTDQEILEYVYQLVAAAKRPMPAYFTSTADNTREKTFGVYFDGIVHEEEYGMSGIAYKLSGDFIKVKDSLENGFFCLLGEDAMIGSYILAKLKKPELAPDLEKRLSQRTLDRLQGYEALNADEGYNRPGVREWMDFCISEGIHMAQYGRASDRCLALDGIEGGCPHCLSNT